MSSSAEHGDTLPTVEKVDGMKVDELKDALAKLQLSRRGNRSTLAERLKAAINGEQKGSPSKHKSDSEPSDEEGNSTDSSASGGYDTSQGNATPQQQRENIKRIASRRSAMAEAATEGPKVQVTNSHFTIKDVEDSISHFSGDDGLQIEKWMEEFEDISALLKWNGMQKLIYAKKLLKGSAKQFISLEKHVTSWDELKNRLIKEFKVEINSAVIHAKLASRQRQPNENAKQYIYAMQVIASQGNIEEEALIQYIADGTPGDEFDKAILYRSITIAELKKCLEVYDRMSKKKDDRKGKTTVRKENRGSTKEDKNSSSSNSSGSRKKNHCFKCG